MHFYKKKVGEKNFIAHASEGTDWVSADAVLRHGQTTASAFQRADVILMLAFVPLNWVPSMQLSRIGRYHLLQLRLLCPLERENRGYDSYGRIRTLCKTCIVVPSDLLRKQTITRFCTLGKLREIGAINDTFENPVVGCLVSSPKDITELQELLDKSNLIVTTMSLLNSGYFKDEFIRLLASTCDTLVIDEAHHVPASSWKQVKKAFQSVRCLQFTATPFRNDGKKIDGDIIYNFPLALAQERGYFKSINFYPIYEFDSDKKICR